MQKRKVEKALKKGAQKGNKNGIKLKFPLIRKEAYKQYCQWIAEGNPKQAWCFEHEKYTCTFKTMDKYILHNPLEFPAIHKEIAQAKGYNTWVLKGMDMMMGRTEKCQPAIYQMFMRNMFGWDKEDRTTKDTNEPLVKKIAELWRK